MTNNQALTTDDRFTIFEQLNLHQHYIDNDSSLESVEKYQSLYWEEAKFTVIDVREVTFEGFAGLKQLYDYAHSVFPLSKWRHSLGSFKIDGGGDEATVEWRWRVSWMEDEKGVVSSGTYTDKFQKRDGQWKCLERTSNVDPNFPASLFQPFVDDEKNLFKAS